MEAVWFKLSGFHGSVGEPTVEVCLSLGRRDIADGFQQPVIVEPGHPFQGGELDRFPALPGCPTVNQFRLVQAVDGLGQGIDAPMSTGTPGVGQIGKNERVQFPHDIALQATVNFLVRHAFLGPASDIDLCPWIAPHPYHGDGP